MFIFYGFFVTDCISTDIPIFCDVLISKYIDGNTACPMNPSFIKPNAKGIVMQLVGKNAVSSDSIKLLGADGFEKSSQMTTLTSAVADMIPKSDSMRDCKSKIQFEQ
ncbi:1661_t:CDS:1 [Ambispora leptoticha]|uniref:1661_t:CDS:1 n=1 Tax=Ambispora leptoticha TaxID=144679 RepID=A0A9N9C239_9GLOM|nr:1661_t:CDS:1 [Ambispora leptoticha]